MRALRSPLLSLKTPGTYPCRVQTIRPAFRQFLRVEAVGANNGVVPELSFLRNKVENYALIFFSVFGFDQDGFALFVGFCALGKEYVWAKFVVCVRHGYFLKTGWQVATPFYLLGSQPGGNVLIH
jgi:hypothetical protein